MTTAIIESPPNNGALQVDATRKPLRPASAIEVMAQRLKVDPAKLFQSLAATVFAGASTEEMLGLVVVSNEYKLNPFLRQIYAFPKKGGGIVPIVGIDGWAAIINSQEQFDGCEFLYEDDDGTPVSCTCVMHVKDRSHPIKITEFFAECRRNTEPWNAMPRRMLRHKSYMQAGRLAFGLGGIYDEDEGRDVAQGVLGGKANEVELEGTPRPISRTAQVLDRFNKQKPAEDAAAPAPEKLSPAETILAPTWDELTEQGITRVAEDDGIAVQTVAGGLTLRPDGQWDAAYGAWTVQPNNAEQDLLARTMAMKAVASIPATEAHEGGEEEKAPPAPPAPRNRPGPKR